MNVVYPIINIFQHEHIQEMTTRELRDAIIPFLHERNGKKFCELRNMYLENSNYFTFLKREKIGLVTKEQFVVYFLQQYHFFFMKQKNYLSSYNENVESFAFLLYLYVFK